MATKTVTRSWTWDLAAPRERLWPLLCDTERLNEALGLPCYRLRETIDTDGMRRRYGEYDAQDQRIRWEEPPMEWAAPHWWRWTREYESGPFERGAATLVLEPDGSGGTRATYTLEVVSRGVMGRALIASGHLSTAARGFERIAKLADSHCRKPLGDFYVNLAASRASAPKVRKANGAANGTSERFSALRDWIAVAPACDLLELRPKTLARALGLRVAETLILCHDAVEEGLLQLRFRVTCPQCQRVARESETPADVPPTFGCRHCAAPIERDFGVNVEMMFRVVPSVREIPDAVHCGSTPHRTPLALLQQSLDPRERRELEIGLPAGMFRARLIDGPAGGLHEFDAATGLLIRTGADWLETELREDTILTENHGDRPVTLIVETVGIPAGATMLAEALTVQCWFDSYNSRTLGILDEVPCGEGAVLVVIDESEARDETVARTVAACEGALVEADDISCLLLFAHPEQARAAADMLIAGLEDATIGGAFGEVCLIATEGAPLLDGEAVETAREQALSGGRGQFVASETLSDAPLDLLSVPEPARAVTPVRR